MALTKHWRKSKRSGEGGGNCVEAREVGGDAQMRDSKDPTGGVLTFAGPAWRAFLSDVKVGALDPRNHV